MNLVLASQSPRRKELLERMGLTGLRTIAPEIDEAAFSGLPPEELVRTLSQRKALAVSTRVDGDALVIAADTVVVLDGSILGKPTDRDDAVRMLRGLSGSLHQVYTGVTVWQGERQITEHEVTDVWFRSLSEADVAYYVRTGESMDKAGAYGIQGYGAMLVERVSGDYYNVMGLPVCRLGRILFRFGVDCLCLAAGGNASLRGGD